MDRWTSSKPVDNLELFTHAAIQPKTVVV